MTEDRNDSENGPDRESGSLDHTVPGQSLSNVSNTVPGDAPRPSFVDPLKDALIRMRDDKAGSPSEFETRSVSLLSSRLGTASEPVSVNFAFGSVGVQADHSHYFNGFALLKPMRNGTAVAVRFSDSTGIRLVVEGVPEISKFGLNTEGDDTEALIVRTVREILAGMPKPFDRGLDVAVVSAVPLGLESAYLSSVCVSLARAADDLLGSHRGKKDRIQAIKGSLKRILPYPFSIGYVIAAANEKPDPFLLVDTETMESLSLDSSSSTEPGWALVDTVPGAKMSDRKARSDRAQEILTRLQQKQFSALTSFRDLEHRDLENASQLLPRRMRPGLKYLVSENRRVQRLVTAIRNEDWQLMGALLFMSHASRRDDWAITSPIQDFVVEEAERFSIEGVYGATQIGEGSFVLIAGQPIRLPAFLDHLRSNWPAHALGRPETLIL